MNRDNAGVLISYLGVRAACVYLVSVYSMKYLEKSGRLAMLVLDFSAFKWDLGTLKSTMKMKNDARPPDWEIFHGGTTEC